LSSNQLTRSGLAAICIAIALLLSLWLEPTVDATTLFLVAIVVVAWFGGLGPGLLAVVLATLAVDYAFTPPLYALKFGFAHAPRVTLFALLAAFIASASASRRQAEASLRKARDDLDVRVRERTAELSQANHRLATQYAATSILAESDGIARATPKLLQAIGQSTGWEWGALWTVDRAAGVLRCQNVWHQPDVEAAEFDAAIRQTTFAVGTGIPGLVCQRAEPLWIPDVTQDPTFARSASVPALGLKSAMAFPIDLGGDAFGVIEFMSRTVRQPDRQQLETLTAIGSQIGQFIERRRAEEAVREQADLLNLTHDTVFVRDWNDVITYWNRGAEELYGWTRAEAVGRTSHELMHTAFPVPLPEIMGELLRTGRWEGELVHTDRNGTRVNAASRWSLQRDAQGQPAAILETNNDVTERKRAEEALDELAGRLINAQEEERSRIGRELHDHVSQRLGILAIKIDQLRAEPSMTPASIGDALDDVRQHTSEITGDVHRLSHRLHSSMLDHLGLVPALHRLVNEFAERHQLAIGFSHAPMPSALPPDVALCLFRVAEESLTNIAKHSGARSARVDLAGGNDGIRLTVEDTGRGFDQKSLEQRAGLGFVSMRERLRLVHGTLHIRSAPSRGTRIEARIPARTH
jgi:PAS domain S-box-containing protein